MKRSIVTIKWGSEFSSEHVNILMRAAHDHTSIVHDFYCFTDDPTGLDPRIKARPIPTRGLSRFPKSSGCWPKVCLFHPDLSSELESILYLDIDTVVVGSIDCFFESQGAELRMLSCGDAWKRLDSRIPPQPATGVFSCQVGRHFNIFEEFAENPNRAYANFRNEQAYVGSAAKEVAYFPLNWIVSFKYHLRQPYILDLFLPPRKPSDEVKMVAFHGFPRPHKVANTGECWARFPRSGLHRPNWLIEYWRKYSDHSNLAD